MEEIIEQNNIVFIPTDYQEPKKRGRKPTLNVKENKKAYYKKYYQTNQDKWRKRMEDIRICEVCNKQYKLHKKCVHMKSKQHLMCVNAFQMGFVSQSTIA